MYIVLLVIIFILLFINIRLYYKYIGSLNDITEYEEIIKKYRVLNHENRNHLLIIRNMGNYKLAKKYIDNILDSRDDKTVDKILRSVYCKHLKAILYSKLIKMKDNNIEFEFLSRNLNRKIFNDLDNKTILDISEMINIFLDNSIDESIINKGKITICIYKDEELVISISNNCYHELELEKIYNIGYSSKGKEHGYGLSIVKDIITRNRDIINEIELNNGVFTQIIKYK